MQKIIKVVFYQTDQGKEPVKEWLLQLRITDRKLIGVAIKTVEYGWPIGMPVVRKIDTLLWEVRVNIQDGIARVLFTVVDDSMVLLHGFVKKSQKMPSSDLKAAKQRLKNL